MAFAEPVEVGIFVGAILELDDVGVRDQSTGAALLHRLELRRGRSKDGCKERERGGNDGEELHDDQGKGVERMTG